MTMELLRRGGDPPQGVETMFALRRGGTVIGNGLKIVGNVTAEGLVEVNGRIEGDVHCPSLIVSPNAQIIGSITAERVVVNGRVEGPIQGGDVVLKPRAHVIGVISHQSLTTEKGAKFDGRATLVPGSSGGKLVTIGERAKEVSREANTAA